MGTRTAGGTDTLDRTQDRVEEPPRYSCVLHNDHFTTRDFVVYVLVAVFKLSEADAERKMLEVHRQGQGRVGSFSFDMARTKAAQTEKLARDNSFPLKCTVEPL